MTGPAVPEPTDPWQIVYTAHAALQTRGLPATPYEDLVRVLVAISRDPWNASAPDLLEESPAWRWTPFADVGLVHVFVDDVRHAVRVYDVTWTG